MPLQARRAREGRGRALGQKQATGTWVSGGGRYTRARKARLWSRAKVKRVVVGFRRLVMLSLVVVIIAFAGEGAEEPQTRHEYVAPISDVSMFNPLPEMWGLRQLNEDTRLEDLDESFVLYLTERALFKIGDKGGQVYFTIGRQLIPKEELVESDISAHLGLFSCLCALEYACADAWGAQTARPVC